MAPAVKSFRAAYPEIELEFSFSDAFSNILGDELHAGFRLGDRIAQDMVAIRLTQPLKLGVFVSPKYLCEFGSPAHPSDLLDHECIRYRFQTSGNIADWTFVDGETEYNVDVEGYLTVNTLPAMVDLALRGQGLIMTFRAYCQSSPESGSLTSVLEEHIGETQGLHIYFPREYRSMVPLRLFIEHLRSFTVV